MRLFGLLVLTITFAFGLAKVLNCPEKLEKFCEMNCWEECFVPPTKNIHIIKAYQNLYQMAIGIKNLYGPCNKPMGTAYLLDASIRYAGLASSYELQRTLASIVAIVQPAGSGCNPFCMNKYINFGAFYPYGKNVPCLDRCEASRFFHNPFSKQYFIQNTSPWYTWNSMGQYLARHCFQKEKCAACSEKELLLFFANDPNFASWWNYCPTGSHYECAVVGVSHSPLLNNFASWSNSKNLYQIKPDKYHIYAAKNIWQCMNRNCCPQISIKGRDNNEAIDESLDSRASAERYNVAILGPNNQPKVTVNTGTQDDIFQTIQKAPKPRPTTKPRPTLKPKPAPNLKPVIKQ